VGGEESLGHDEGAFDVRLERMGSQREPAPSFERSELDSGG